MTDFTLVIDKRKAKRQTKQLQNRTQAVRLEVFEAKWKLTCETKLQKAIAIFEQATPPAGETPEEKQRWLDHNLALARVHFANTKGDALKAFLSD